MGLEPLELPPKRVSEESHNARLHGIYPQRGSALSFQRVRLPGGRIRADQWRGLAALAAEYSPEFPLHVTTRQDIELHGVRSDDLPDIQDRIEDLGMTGSAACGDSVRNITFCPSNGFRRSTWDVSELATSMRACVLSIPWIADLPRKFKISICGCFDSCTRPWINDLGLVANPDGTFRAVVAGSLGSTPRTGLLLFDSLDVRQVLPLMVALLRLFFDQGDRMCRHCGRLRHVRERVGDDRFKELVSGLFREESGNLAYATPRVSRVEEETPCRARLRLPLGDIPHDMAFELGRIVEKAGAELRIGLEHDLLVFGHDEIDLGKLRAFVDGAPIVACPGSSLCTKGIANSRGAAERIGRRLSADGCPSIAVSGCPNNCAHAAVAPIGLVGRTRRLGNETVEGFRILAGGGRGVIAEMGIELHPFVAANDIDEAVALIVQEYHRNSKTRSPESFIQFISRKHSDLIELLRIKHPLSVRKKVVGPERVGSPSSTVIEGISNEGLEP